MLDIGCGVGQLTALGGAVKEARESGWHRHVACYLCCARARRGGDCDPNIRCQISNIVCLVRSKRRCRHCRKALAFYSQHHCPSTFGQSARQQTSSCCSAVRQGMTSASGRHPQSMKVGSQQQQKQVVWFWPVIAAVSAVTPLACGGAGASFSLPSLPAAQTSVGLNGAPCRFRCGGLAKAWQKREDGRRNRGQ